LFSKLILNVKQGSCE